MVRNLQPEDAVDQGNAGRVYFVRWRRHRGFAVHSAKPRVLARAELAPIYSLGRGEEQRGDGEPAVRHFL